MPCTDVQNTYCLYNDFTWPITLSVDVTHADVMLTSSTTMIYAEIKSKSPACYVYIQWQIKYVSGVDVSEYGLRHERPQQSLGAEPSDVTRKRGGGPPNEIKTFVAEFRKNSGQTRSDG